MVRRLIFLRFRLLILGTNFNGDPEEYPARENVELLDCFHGAFPGGPYVDNEGRSVCAVSLSVMLKRQTPAGAASATAVAG